MTSKKVKPAKKSGFSSLNTKTQVFIKAQILALILYMISFLVASGVSLAFNVSVSYAFYVCIFAFAISSFLCALYSGYKIHKKGIVIGFLFCLPFNLLVTLISAILNSFSIDLTAVISLFIMIVSSMLGGMVSVNIRIKPKRK